MSDVSNEGRRKPGRPPRLDAPTRAPQRGTQRGRPFKLRTAENRFDVDMSRKPKDMDYMWGVVSVIGQPAEEQMATRWANGWRAVPSYRHPELTSIEDKNDPKAMDPIVRGGQRLEERAMEISDYARQVDDEAAADQMNNQVRRLQLGQDGSNTRKKVKVEQKYVPMTADD